MKQAEKPKFNWKSLVRWLLLIVCGAVLGVNVYLANANRLMGEQLPMPFGYGAAVVLSGSMEPTFSEGDLIIVKECHELQENDIVVFQDGGSLVVHRIISVDTDTAITKGDANDASDAPINISAIKGTVLFWIPFAGRVVEGLKTPIGTICVIVAAIALVELPRRKEKKQDDEQRKQLLEEIARLKEEN